MCGCVVRLMKNKCFCKNSNFGRFVLKKGILRPILPKKTQKSPDFCGFWRVFLVFFLFFGPCAPARGGGIWL